MTTPLDERVNTLEQRVEALHRYLADDRSITASVERLDTGVVNLSAIMQRLEDNTAAIGRVSQQTREIGEESRALNEETKTIGKEASSKSTQARTESRIYSALILVIIVFSMALVGSYYEAESHRRKDLERTARETCALGNERVDQVAKLARDLTVNAPPEGKARVEKALIPFVESKRDCEELP